MLSIRLDPEIEQRLKTLSEQTARPISYYARKAIEEAIEDMEDTYIAIERLENPGRIWTHDEIKRGADLEN